MRTLGSLRSVTGILTGTAAIFAALSVRAAEVTDPVVWVAKSVREQCLGEDLTAEAMMRRANARGWPAFSSEPAPPEVGDDGFKTELLAASIVELGGAPVSFFVTREVLATQGHQIVERIDCAVTLHTREIVADVGPAISTALGSGAYRPGAYWAFRVDGDTMRDPRVEGLTDKRAAARYVQQPGSGQALIVVAVEAFRGDTVSRVSVYRTRPST